jgi:hypothetical protein
MSFDGQDREIAQLFEEQRRADEASAPAFRDLLARRRAPKAPLMGWIWGPAVAAAAVLVVVAVLLLDRPHPRPVPASPLPAVAVMLAAWKAPTDVLLRTPGAELLSGVPTLVSRLPDDETRRPPAMEGVEK